MKRGKGKRRLSRTSSSSTPNRSPSNELIHSERVVWFSNDNDPKSPLSIELLPRNVGRRISKVIHVKSAYNLHKMARKRKGFNSESCFPFFIDKTPRKVQACRSYKKRRIDVNNSIVVLDSPSTNSSGNVFNGGQVLQPVRKDSVDTVDLCSDSEEEHDPPNRSSKHKQITATNSSEGKNSNQKVSDNNPPDIIILDDEEESINNRSENNASIIVESVGDIKPSSIPLPTSGSATSTSASVAAGSISIFDSVLPSHPSLVSAPTPSSSLCPSYNPAHDTVRGTLIPNLHTNAGPSTSYSPTSNLGANRSHPHNCGSIIRIIPSDINESGSLRKVNSTSVNIFGPSRNMFTKDNSRDVVLPSSVGSNVFNPNVNVKQTGLRPIIIDGCNVAIAHGGDRTFSVRGLCICIEYFLRRGHSQVLALVPLHHRCKVSPQDREILESLQNDQHLVYTPSRYINKRLISSYDDRYIVQYAAAVGGVIVSRDNYRDLLAENPAWKDTILNRLLMPTWVGDMLMFPVDPLGKNGPTLDEFLSFPKK